MASAASARRGEAEVCWAPASPSPSFHDLRFSALVGLAGWARLPLPVRQRFGRHPGPGNSVTYAGKILDSRRTLVGRLLAQLARLIGAPLPLEDGIGLPAVVTVTEDHANGGQFWTRMYGRRHGFPQVIHSSKRFSGPTGLEEYLGCGFGIALAVSADGEALHFRSDHYFVSLGAFRFRLPRWLAPGALTIRHVERGEGWFAFVLSLDHPLFGRMIQQTAVFRQRFVSQEEEQQS